jgi:ActR/RegA family two-component response regulator
MAESPAHPTPPHQTSQHERFRRQDNGLLSQDLHALIIEDDLVSGLSMQMALTPLGFTSFAFASTPRQALEQARLRRPDLMTVDIHLLDGDGPQAVRDIEGVLGDLAVLYVTGAPHIAPALGGRELLCKPFGVADVQAAYGRLRRPVS